MTDRLDSRHGWVWRWCFAVRGTPQVLHGWGSWDSRTAASAALAAHKRRNRRRHPTLMENVEVRRVPCNLQPLDNYLPGGARHAE